MHVTIDGKTVRPDGRIDWVGEGPEAYDFEAFDRVDACVLGRVMYPEYEEYWRGVVAGADDTLEAKRYAEFADRTPHYVLTRTTTEFDWPVAQWRCRFTAGWQRFRPSILISMATARPRPSPDFEPPYKPAMWS